MVGSWTTNFNTFERNAPRSSSVISRCLCFNHIISQKHLALYRVFIIKREEVYQKKTSTHATECQHHVKCMTYCRIYTHVKTRQNQGLYFTLMALPAGGCLCKKGPECIVINYTLHKDTKQTHASKNNTRAGLIYHIILIIIGKSLLLSLCLLSAILMHKEISRTFEMLRSQVKSESCVLALCDSPVTIWPNRGFCVTPDEITPNTLCEDLHKWIL